jgi:2,3-dihydroxybenzoate decarboxylase
MFSVDYPFEKPAEAGEWIEAAAISDAERRAVCRDNTAALLGL